MHQTYGLMIFLFTFKWEILGSILAKEEFEPHHCEVKLQPLP